MKKHINILFSLLLVGIATSSAIRCDDTGPITADVLVPKGAGRFSLPTTKTEEVFALLLVLLTDLALRRERSFVAEGYRFVKGLVQRLRGDAKRNGLLADLRGHMGRHRSQYLIVALGTVLALKGGRDLLHQCPLRTGDIIINTVWWLLYVGWLWSNE